MAADQLRPQRRSPRLQGYDYSQNGAYFVTICTQNRVCLFGEVVDGTMRLNTFGQIAETCWREIPDHFRRVILDSFVVMPNHVHGILFLLDMASVGTQHAASLHESRPGGVTPNNVKPHSLPAIIRSYKSAVTKSINTIRSIPGAPVWQGRYYDHIIRNERSLDLIREYVMYNPGRWQEDRLNLGNLPESLDL